MTLNINSHKKESFPWGGGRLLVGPLSSYFFSYFVPPLGRSHVWLSPFH